MNTHTGPRKNKVHIPRHVQIHRHTQKHSIYRHTYRPTHMHPRSSQDLIVAEHFLGGRPAAPAVGDLAVGDGDVERVVDEVVL